MLGNGARLTSALSPETELRFERERALPGGSVEIVYAVGGRAALPGQGRAWAPGSQRGG